MKNGPKMPTMNDPNKIRELTGHPPKNDCAFKTKN